MILTWVVLHLPVATIGRPVPPKARNQPGPATAMLAFRRKSSPARSRRPPRSEQATAIGCSVIVGFRGHGHCNNRPAGHKQESERTQSWIRYWGKVTELTSYGSLPVQGSVQAVRFESRNVCSGSEPDIEPRFGIVSSGPSTDVPNRGLLYANDCANKYA
jgi:hypothetical protein